jgi:hypothetical protein
MESGFFNNKYADDQGETGRNKTDHPTDAAKSVIIKWAARLKRKKMCFWNFFSPYCLRIERESIEIAAAVISDTIVWNWNRIWKERKAKK